MTWCGERGVTCTLLPSRCLLRRPTRVRLNHTPHATHAREHASGKPHINNTKNSFLWIDICWGLLLTNRH